jgi:hypothetical protein
MKHLRWPIVGFENIPRVRGADPGIGKTGDTRYPLRFYRYWFGLAALRELHERLGRRISVLEVGIDAGQMPAFVGGPPRGDGTFALPDWIGSWVGVDVRVDPSMLKRFGYSGYFERNIEAPLDLDTPPADAIVLLHLLEQLLEPELALERLLPYLAPGGQMIGGSPTMPHWIGRRYESVLRKRAAPRMHDVRLHKHLSVITGHRLRLFAARHGLKVDVLTGAFFLRNSSSPVENSLLWYRANMLWGALFPPLGSEVYFVLEKPA